MISINEFTENIKCMTRYELEEELEILYENLEDIKIERRLLFSRMGKRIGKIESYRNSFDREIFLIKKKISLVKNALGI